MKVERFFVERLYDSIAANLKEELRSVLDIDCKGLKIIERYDIEGVNLNQIEEIRQIFAQPAYGVVSKEYDFDNKNYIIVEPLEGQYDQRADSAKQCLLVISPNDKIAVRCATIYFFEKITAKEKQTLADYLINPVESKEGDLRIPKTLLTATNTQNQMRVVVDGFINMDKVSTKSFFEEKGFAMTYQDLIFVQSYFAREKRDPTLTELKVIDTYWSDHCRHTTFLTELKEVKIHKDNAEIAKTFAKYQKLFAKLYKNKEDKYYCLMDIATIAAKELSKKGYLDNLDISEEINACSVVVEVDNDGKNEEWLIMFKNETHNHPTEIEPFGGAATCLGGAIRDPLSGRAYVYQAMRITGAGNPLEAYYDTLTNKLPQRLITTTALKGFSSYNNQIGLASSLAHELYHDRYRAKRLEAGYVIGGVKRENVVRRTPKNGDVVLLVGGETGRDGCGGATSSSKSHSADSAELCGAEVQKGNPIEERKIQRLFRRKEVAQSIIKCNDFGAGGISVAIGELARGIDIYLDKVITKYGGLTATELAISESQERMAVVCAKEDLEKFVVYAEEENLKATHIATITNTDRLKMYYKEEVVVDIHRQFLDTNGVKQSVDAYIEYDKNDYFETIDKQTEEFIQDNKYLQALCYELNKLSNCSQKGMGEVFDSTAGAGSVIMPFGGKLQLTPSMIMASKPPVDGHTNTVTCSSFGVYPQLMIKSPYIGAIYSVVGAINKLIASGVKYSTIRLSLQEYFKRLAQSPERWGEPLAALLGAFDAEINLKLAAIGGKDSMSGTYEDMDVPPTLIAFAMGITDCSRLVHNAFGSTGYIYRYSLPRKEEGKPDYKKLDKIYKEIEQLIGFGCIKWSAVEESNFLVTLAKSLMGNRTGARLEYINKNLFMPSIGNIIIVTEKLLTATRAEYMGTLDFSGKISCGNMSLCVEELTNAFVSPLSSVFINNYATTDKVKNLYYEKNIIIQPQKLGAPRVFIPVFPGTSGEWDMAKAFCNKGAKVEEFVIRNKTAEDIKQSITALRQKIDASQIIAFAGGSSAGDEPSGSGKLIMAVFNNPLLKESIVNLRKREGLILGIDNGFQALVKLGLLSGWSSKTQSVALVTNKIGRNVSGICKIRIASNNSPWLHSFGVGDTFSVPVSHKEGRFVASDTEIEQLIKNGQIATQYIDFEDNATLEYPYNPSGSMCAVEGLLSSDGRVFGKMGHTERIAKDLYKNVSGRYDMDIFENGVKYFL